jgi:SSS family transporter
MFRHLFALVMALAVGARACGADAPASGSALHWSSLPPLPDPEGVAAPFVGLADGQLLVAGGANFPAAKPWEGGVKVWHDTVYALAAPAGAWRVAGRLPTPVAYGVSITTPEGLLCVGGSSTSRHYRSVFRLNLTTDGVLRVTELPPLPIPLADMGGALLGQVLHLAGGAETPGEQAASARHFSLDLARPETGWIEREPLPGPARIQPLAAALDGRFHLCGGAALEPNAEGRIARVYLADAWAYRPGQGWQRRADLPHPLAAAPSPAPVVGPSHFLALGGNDGTQAGFQPVSQHPGFTRGILAYHSITDTWTRLGDWPGQARVTTTPVAWHGRWVLPSGEVRPGVRSPEMSAFSVSVPRDAFGAINWLVVTVYLGGMVAVGWWFMRREAASTTEAYFRGGQRVPWLVAGLSIFATMLSSLTFMGIPARAYQTDLSWYIGQLPILLIAPLVAFCYLPFFRKLDLTSAYEYLERRFGLGARLFASTSFILFHLGRVAIVLYLPALALAAVSDIGVSTAIVVIGALCVVYTVMGGITAVVWTDAVQAVVLLGGALLCLVIAVSRVDGGVSALWATAAADGKLFQSLDANSWSIRDGTSSLGVLFLAFFFNSLVPYTSSQDVVQRYVTTRDIASARRSLWTTMVLSILGSMIFFLLGAALYAFYKAHPDRLAFTLPATDAILPYYIVHELPLGISGLVIAAIFAASQSTISSSLNSVATAWTKDFDQRLLRPGRDDRTYLRSAMIVVVALGLVGIAIALWMAGSKLESAFKTFNTMIGLTAGALGGLFALGVFTRRAHGTGALVGAFAGAGLVIGLHLARTPVTGLLYATIGFATCVVVGWVASLILPGRRGEGLSLHG